MERGDEGSTASAKLHENKIARMGKDGKLHLPPNILKLKEPLLPRKPLRAPHRAFSKAAAGLCVVAEIDSVVLGIEHQFVHPYNFAFPKRGYLAPAFCNLLHAPMLDCCSAP